MEISAALAAGLNALSAALDETDPHHHRLETLLRDMVVDLRGVVSSYVGLTITLVTDGWPVRVTAMIDEALVVATSMALSLTALSNAEPGSVLVMYAAIPGAFVDLAADMAFALSLQLDAVEIDAHLEPAHLGTGIDGLGPVMRLNQAIGILIDRGRTPEQARHDLEQNAQRSGVTVAEAADALIETVQRGPLEHPPT